MALVCGRVSGTGRVAAPLDGRACLTTYEAADAVRSARHRWVTSVRLSPHTGALPVLPAGPVGRSAAELRSACEPRPRGKRQHGCTAGVWAHDAK